MKTKDDKQKMKSMGLQALKQQQNGAQAQFYLHLLAARKQAESPPIPAYLRKG